MRFKSFGRATGMVLRLLAVLTIVLASNPMAAQPAAAQSNNPRDIVTFDDEAGKAAFSTKDEDGSDSFGEFTHRRWNRDRDNEDVRVGPIITDSKVWVTKDVETAKRLFKQETDKNKEFPEREDNAKGPFPFKVGEGPKLEEVAEETSALSACRDCDSIGSIDIHHRIVIRTGKYVATTYIYGRESVAKPELVVWLAKKMGERMRPPAPEPAEGS